MGAVKLQSESVMAARFSTEEVLGLITANDYFVVSDSESSEKKGKGLYAYIERFQEVALSRLEL